RETVGVRVPSNEVARLLLVDTGRPIAAPSANRSTGVSPTLAHHVLEDLDGKIDLVLDSGQTDVGLESTVLDLTTRRPRVLRPGPVPAGESGAALGGECVANAGEPEPGASLASPGQMAVHYAPLTPAVRVDEAELADVAWPDRAAVLVVGRHDLPPLPPGLL